MAIEDFLSAYTDFDLLSSIVSCLTAKSGESLVIPSLNAFNWS